MFLSVPRLRQNEKDERGEKLFCFFLFVLDSVFGK